MDEVLYNYIKAVMTEQNLDVDLLENSYIKRVDRNVYFLNQTLYVQYFFHKNYGAIFAIIYSFFVFPCSTIEADVIEKTTKVIRKVASILSDRGIPVDPQLLHSAVEHQVKHALSKSYT